MMLSLNPHLIYVDYKEMPFSEAIPFYRWVDYTLTYQMNAHAHYIIKFEKGSNEKDC